MSTVFTYQNPFYADKDGIIIKYESILNFNINKVSLLSVQIQK